ncbi:pyridoxal phosphate-dependent aminotransferase [Desulfitobacterium sp. Sab5]|uniref:pyridoxal phosphate-dependent aminotransferase n=1 Tax=Desulfitobacterium nosdiversum TaxID=3375356 RepID=UPI003CEB9967
MRRLHGGNLREAEERFGKNDFIDLSANINPFGPPQGVWKRLRSALPEIIHYPDPENKRLTQKLSEQFKLLPEQILVGNGAGELLFTLTLALKPKKVLIPVPGFSEYERAARAVGAEVRYMKLGVKGWDSLPQVKTPEDKNQYITLWQQLLNDCDLIYLNSPHNPTGSVLRVDELKIILEIARKSNCWIVFDESFYDFLDNDLRWTARIFLEENPKLIVIYSMTKFFSLPGIRLGVLFSNQKVLDCLQRFRDPWSVNVLAEEAGIEAVADSVFPMEVRSKLKDSKDFFYREFERAKFKALTLHFTHVNFALIEIKDRTSLEIVERLGKLGILVRNCDSFQGIEGQYIRVAIKDKESMKRLIEGLQAIY